MHENIIAKRNRFHIEGDTGYLTIIRRDRKTTVAMFDAADLELVKHHAPWHVASWAGAGEERIEYVAACLPNRKLITLHRFIMETEPDSFCRIIDKNPLNCRRSNLENVAERMKLGSAPRRSGVKWIYYDTARQLWQIHRRDPDTGKMRCFGVSDSLEKAKKMRREFEREEKSDLKKTNRKS